MQSLFLKDRLGGFLMGFFFVGLFVGFFLGGGREEGGIFSILIEVLGSVAGFKFCASCAGYCAFT